MHEIQSESKWCLDSGCTSHMCKDERKFQQLSHLEGESLNLANCNSTEICAKGTVQVNILSNKNQKVLKLENTLLVPDLRSNLLSVSKITDSGHNVLFTREGAFVHNIEGETKWYAERLGNLYYIRENVEQSATASVSDGKSSLETWHKRFGHLNERDLKKMMADDLKTKVWKEGDVNLSNCKVCLKGKFTKLPFPKNSDRSTKPLEIIHTDVCGPMRTESLGKSKYFIVFIDDCTRWCEVRFIREKSDVLESFKQYKSLMENQFNASIKCVQSDNGKEYCNNEFNNFLDQCGIKRRLTVPHTPEQNGIAERRNRTLVEMARCMLLESKLPPTFWGEAIATANYVRNRSPSRSVKGNTPYEILFGSKPNISYFKIFGSKAYVLNKDPTKGKFEPRSIECTFVGYSETSKAYRFWISEKRKIITARDVKFLDEFEKSNNYDDFIPENMRLKIQGQVTAETSKMEEIEIEYPINNINIEEDEFLSISSEDEFEEVEEEVQEEDREEIEEEIVPEGEEIQQPQGQRRRGSGRPTFLRTGERERPKKIYQPPREIEFAGSAEVNLQDAISGNDAENWLLAIDDEFRSLINNDTWELVDKPQGKNIISCRIVLRNKCGPGGNLERRKARLVARGFSQQPGIDFHETFAPVARLSSFRILTALAIENDMIIHQLDITTAYLNGIIEEEIFMKLPDMYEEILLLLIKKMEPQKDHCDESLHTKAANLLKNLRKGNQVCLLKKGLYG